MAESGGGVDRPRGLDHLRQPVVAARWVVTGIAVLASVVVVRYPVSDNVRYVLGLLRVSGYSPAATFTHRPITYRLLMAAQAWLPGIATDGIGEPGSLQHLAAFETGLNVVSLLLAGGAGMLVWAGLRRRWPELAWPYGVAAYAGLAFLAPMLGEPDWYAALFAVAGFGAALIGGRWLGGTLGGILLALSALVKFVTLPVALAAFLILWAVDAGRIRITVAAALVFGSLVLVTIWVWAPWEIGWMLDIRALQPPFWSGDRTVEAARNCLVQLAATAPTILLVPAFFPGAPRREQLVASGTLVLVAAPIVLQGEYWLYHATSLLVLSCLLAVRTVGRTRGVLFWPMLALSAWTTLVFVLPWRFRIYAGWNNGGALIGHGKRVIAIAAACSAALLVLQVWTVRRQAKTPAPASPPAPNRAALAVMAALLAAQSPHALLAATEGRQRHVQEAIAVHAVIGGEPVAYAVPGWSTYFLGNPTRCRYPSPLFLQRALAVQVVAPAHRDESLACLSWDGARWLVWKQDWLNPRTAAPDVRATIARIWDCRRSVLVDGYTLCPRRG